MLWYKQVIRHSRLPAGNALWFCQNFFIFLFFRRQGFRMITFDRQSGPLKNFNRSHVMVIGRSVSFSDPVRPPGGGVGRPKHPKIPPPPAFCVLRPQEHFLAEIFFFSSKFHLRHAPPPHATPTPPPPRTPPPRPRPVLRTLTPILVQ